MKNKKSDNANLENKKGIFFLIGLVISLAVVLLAFEWKSNPGGVEVDWGAATFTQEDFVYIPPTREQTVEIPIQKIEIELINIVENNADIIDNSDLFSSDPADDVPIDFNKLIFIEKPDQREKEEEVFIFVEQMPEFPGGEISLLKYLSDAIKYPIIAQENGIHGKVYISFIINEDGSVSNVNLMRGVDSSLDNEALRVVRTLPKWKPGKQGGKAVKVRYNVPINFELR